MYSNCYQDRLRPVQVKHIYDILFIHLFTETQTAH